MLLTSSISTFQQLKPFETSSHSMMPGVYFPQGRSFLRYSPLLINFALHCFPRNLQEILITFSFDFLKNRSVIFWNVILKKKVAKNPIKIFFTLPGSFALKTSPLLCSQSYSPLKEQTTFRSANTTS